MNRPLPGTVRRVQGLFLGLLGCLSALAVEPALDARWGVERFTLEDGLPQSDVQAIAVDPEGWLWLGTLNGLARFDGNRFQVVPRELLRLEGGNSVAFIGIGEDARLWAGNYHSMSRRDADGWSPVALERFESQPDAPQFGLPVGRGRWVFLRDERWSVVQEAPMSPNAKPRLVAVTRGRFEGGHVMLARPGPGGRVTVRDQSARWWEFDPSSDQWRESTPLHAGEERLVQEGLRQAPRAIVLHLDGPESLWIGGRDEGLVHVYRPTAQLLRRADGLRDEDVWSVDDVGDGSVWIGTRSSVECWSGDGRPVFQHDLPHGVPHSVLTAGPGAAWATDGNRIVKVTRSGVEAELQNKGPDWFHFVARAADGTVLAGGRSGVWRRLGDRQWQEVDLPPGLAEATWIHALGQPGGEGWFGSLDHGAVQRTRDGDVHWRPDNGAPAPGLAPFAADRHGGVWFGSTGGLIRFQGGRWRQWRGTLGAADDLLLGLAPSADWRRLWIQLHSGIGVIELDPRGEPLGGASDRIDIPRLALSHPGGFEGNGGFPRSMIRDVRGRIWSASNRGIVRIDAARLDSLGPPTPSVISISGRRGVLWDGTSQAAPPAFRVSADDARFVEIGLACVNLRPELPVRIEYELVGRDVLRGLVGRDRMLRYHDLPPGRTTLRLVAVGPLGRGETTIQMEVGAFWHQTLGFRAGLATLATGSLALGGLALRRRISRRAEARQRTRIEAERWRIARDLHDSVGAGLARISMLTFRHEPELARSAQELMRELEQVVWVVNPKRDNLVATVDFLAKEAELQLSRSEIALEARLGEVPEDVAVTGSVRRALLLILRGALSNVLRHSGAARVTFRMEVAGGRFRMVLQDDGQGFEPAASRGSQRGLDMLRQRALSLGGTWEVESAPGAGTIVRLYVPLVCLETIPDDDGFNP